MSEILHRLISGVTCDTRGCTAEITGELMPEYEGGKHYQALAEAAGWSYYVGRSQRTYCPAHQPGPRHRMRRLSPGRPLIGHGDAGASRPGAAAAYMAVGAVLALGIADLGDGAGAVLGALTGVLWALLGGA